MNFLCKDFLFLILIFVLQIGRSSESPIDFVVVDTVAGEKTGDSGKVVQSTISRFACRILAERANPSVARIYAAGFDSSRNIFLGVCYFYQLNLFSRPEDKQSVMLKNLLF